MVTPCISNIQHFNFQMMHTTLKSVEILKCFNISTFFNVVYISWKLKCCCISLNFTVCTR